VTSFSLKQTHDLDHIVFLGDLVSKGPHSGKVVKLAMKLNASSVIGNHDYELLDWMGYIRTLGDTRLDTFINREDLPKELVFGAEEHALAMGFDKESAEWMLECPYILHIGEVDGEELVAVHAGILPGKELENQGSCSHGYF
jgi:Calcineurin-like phosphoesterase